MDPSTSATDKVRLENIRYEAVVGLDAWHRPGKPQPIKLSIHLSPPAGLEAAAQEDSIGYTIDYGKLYKQLNAVVGGHKFESITQLYSAIRGSLPETRSWLITITLPKAILAAENGLQVSWNGSGDETGGFNVMQVMTVNEIDARCIVGINPHERLEKQRLKISITVWGIENKLSPAMLAGVSMAPSPSLAYQEMVAEIVERVEASSYETIEALATAIAQIVTMSHGFENARVSVDKPGGVAGLGCSGVTIGRTKAYFENKDFWKVKRP